MSELEVPDEIADERARNGAIREALLDAFTGPQDDWYHAPAPFVIHRHRVHTSGTVGDLGMIGRCPCGAYRLSGHWRGERWAQRRVSWLPGRLQK